MRKKSKEDEKTSEELKSAHRRSQAKRQYKPVTLNRLNCTYDLGQDSSIQTDLARLIRVLIIIY